MKRFETIVKPDDDGFVRLTIPVEKSDIEYRVVVVISPEPLDDWPEGFIESTAGKWVGELERPPQGDYEKRISFDEP